MLKKLIIVYNPRSSLAGAIEREVLTPARKISGWLVGRYVVRAASLVKNAQKLAQILNDGDLVVAAGGDGTAAMVANAILRSGKTATLGVLGYGNFNDIARMTRTKRPVEYGGEYVGGLSEIMASFEAGKTAELYPLEVRVNGEHWRYVLAYMTLGMFASSTQIFDEPKIRQRLKKRGGGLVFSVWQLTKWYFREGRKAFLPEGELVRAGKRQESSVGPEIMIDGAAMFPKETTDYLAVNGPRVARVMRGGKWYLGKQGFWSGGARLSSFWRLMGFMLRSMLWRVPGEMTQGDTIEFVHPAQVMIQAEGEYELLEQVQKIEIQKVAQALKIVQRG